MKTESKTLTKATWKQSGTELVILYALTTVGATAYLQTHWLWAMLIAPFLMVVALGGVAALVQAMWMMVVGVERVGTACGLRKSPLA